jgi:hypothetical protein
MSTMMVPHVHPRHKREDSAGDMGVDLGGAPVGSDAYVAPPAIPLVTS